MGHASVLANLGRDGQQGSKRVAHQTKTPGTIELHIRKPWHGDPKRFERREEERLELERKRERQRRLEEQDGHVFEVHPQVDSGFVPECALSFEILGTLLQST